MTKTAQRARHPLEFKREAVRLVESGQTMFNWVKAHRAAKFTGLDSRAVGV